MAFDRFYLALSRQLHNDALMTAFLTVAILALIAYFEYARQRYIISSGVCLGLACLTKSSAIIMVFYFPPEAGYNLYDNYLLPGCSKGISEKEGFNNRGYTRFL